MVLSDFHGAVHILDPLKEKIQEVNPDLITFSGDIVKGYKRGDEWLQSREEKRQPVMTDDIKNEEKEDIHFYRTFFSFLDQLFMPVVVIPGNMDAPESRFPKASANTIHKTLVTTPVTIAGFGGQITEDKEETTFVLQYSRRQVLEVMKEFVATEIKVLITHSPPISMLSFEDGQEKGSLVINDVIDLLNPHYLFCGHAHKSQGAEWIKATFIVNPGALKYGNYAVVEGDSVEFGKVA
ncbi:MAG: metallophosphoesterase family protein [Theionarchaea archaeon]|nr:metallophosphoesterase family protein [Theionarchaea archaeon]